MLCRFKRTIFDLICFLRNPLCCSSKWKFACGMVCFTKVRFLHLVFEDMLSSQVQTNASSNDLFTLHAFRIHSFLSPGVESNPMVYGNYCSFGQVLSPFLDLPSIYIIYLTEIIHSYTCISSVWFVIKLQRMYALDRCYTRKIIHDTDLLCVFLNKYIKYTAHTIDRLLCQPCMWDAINVTLLKYIF